MALVPKNFHRRVVLPQKAAYLFRMKKNDAFRFFTNQLLAWNEKYNHRTMPWKGEKDPYKIWLSEIILQQTRVEQGLAYYKRFVQAFPTVKQLAAAPPDQVFKLWEGLGYYSRCKNLLATANYIAVERGGNFPNTYEDILALKGVGPYTAAAIASFAFDIPKAVVDGNVFRVLSRFFGIATPIDSTDGKKQFTQLAGDLLYTKAPGVYNQSLMDFGATVCKPQSPSCGSCPLQKKCIAYASQRVSSLPIKEKSLVKRTRWLYYLVASCKGNVYIRKRATGDIWENLYEFILIETDGAVEAAEIMKLAEERALVPARYCSAFSISETYKQQLTHQTILGRFIQVTLKKPLTINGYESLEISGINSLPFPKFISSYLKDKTVSLNLF